MNAAQRPVTPSTTSLQSQPLHNRQNGLQRGPSLKASSDARTTHNSTYKPKRTPHMGARRAIAFESSVKLTVNLLLAIVATTTIAKLVPYYQSQQQRLDTLQESVQVAEQRNTELRSQFDRNFDPAQSSRIMQEQSGRTYPNQKKVIWTAPLK
ncbi:MAG: hypothetical protein AAFP03_12605, partial [Cyanobacteria bacterium J06598_3]